jgi:DNA-directed RNA polymerase specialized sigma24 family protein
MARFTRWTVGDVTELIKKATKGDRQAQDELYRQTEPELRKLALHWINRKSAKGPVRTTEVIDRAFVKLMRTIPPRDWQHRGAFYVFASRNILHILSDLLPGYDLRLMSSVKDVSALPTAGKRLVIVAAVDHGLHFRIFDHDGRMVVDTDATRRTAQAPQIEDLRKRLENLWPPHELTTSEKGRVIDAVTSIVGHTPPPPTDPPDGHGLDEWPERARGLTKHTLLTLQEALVDLGQALSETHRKVVELRFLVECTLDEVAELLSMNRDKVFKMSRIALEYLRERLEPSFPDLGRFPKQANGE